MSEKEILTRIGVVGGVLFAVCFLFVAGGLAAAVLFAVLAEATFRQIEYARVAQRVRSNSDQDG